MTKSNKKSPRILTQSKPTTVVQNCKFETNFPQANGHTQASVEALARAAEANANAIAKIAQLIGGGSYSDVVALNIGSSER